MALDLTYRRAAEAALAADAAGAQAHAALFDLARELGDLVRQLQAREAPLALRLRFVRQAPPHLDAPAGVRVEDTKDRAPGYAALILEARDLSLTIESVPGIAVAATTTIPALVAFASRICGVREATDGHPHLLVRGLDGEVTVPVAHDAGALLEAFVAAVAEAFAERAAFNPLPTA